MFGSFFPFERAAQPSELPAPPTRWRGWSRRRMSEPMWKERASEALIRAITISVCLSPAVRHPVSPLSTRALPPSPSAFLGRIASNLHSPTHFPPCHRCWVGSETEPAALWKLQSALFQNTGELVRQLPEIHSINLMPEQMNNWTGTGGGNILCIQSLTFSKKTQSLIWYFVYYLAQRYGSLNLWTQEKWAVIAGCSLFSYNLFQPKYLKLFFLSCYATLPTTGVWSMLRMRQINTTATDLVQGNMRQWHHSLNRMWMRTRLCIHFLNPSQKEVDSCSKLAVRQQVSRENTSIRKLTTKNAATYVDCCLFKFYSELGQLYSSQGEKRRASQRCSLSSRAWEWWPEARTRYATYHIRFHSQTPRPDDTRWASVSRALNVNQHPFRCISYELQPTPHDFPLAA